MLKKILFTLTFAFISLSLFSCVGVQTTSVQTTNQNVNEVVKYQGPKARIAVAKFDCRAAKCYGRIGEGIKDMLVDALVKTGKFIVLERGEGFEAVKEEIELGRSGYIQQGKAPQKGLMEGADILVTGAIVAFEPKASGIKGGVGAILSKIPAIGGVKIGKNDAYIAAIIRLIDTRTGRIISSTRVEGSASSFSIGGLGGWLAGSIGLGGGLEVYKNTPMEKAIMVLIDNAVKEIEKNIPENYYRYTASGKVIAGNTDITNNVNNTSIPKQIENNKLIFKDDFETYGLGQKPPLSKWSGIANATVRIKPQRNKNLGKILDFDDTHNFICAKIPKVKNFTVVLEYQNDGYHDANLFFRMNKHIGYRLKMRSNNYSIRKIAGEDEIEIAQNSANDLNPVNNWFRVKLIVNNSNIKVYSENKLVLDITDTDSFLSKAGDICINGESWFDNIYIYK